MKFFVIIGLLTLTNFNWIECGTVSTAMDFYQNFIDDVLNAFYTIRNFFLRPLYELLKFSRDKIVEHLKSKLYPFLADVIPGYQEFRLVLEHAETLFCWLTNKIFDGIVPSDINKFIWYFIGLMDSMSLYVRYQVDKMKNFINSTLDKGAHELENIANNLLIELELSDETSIKNKCLQAVKPAIEEFKVVIYNSARTCIDTLLENFQNEFEYIRNLTVVYPRESLKLRNRTIDCIDSILDSVFNANCIWEVSEDAMDISITLFTAARTIGPYLVKFVQNTILEPSICTVVMAGENYETIRNLRNIVTECWTNSR